jgi:polar amino acid transport system substrate-binding protein
MPLQDMLEALENNTVDLSIACLFLTAQREERFEFSSPLGSTGLVLATLPDRIEHPWWTAMRIFTSWGTLKVVVSLLFLLLVTGCVFWLIERTKNPEHFGGGLKGIGAGVYWAGSVLASGVCFGIYLKSLTGRIMGICWMFLCAIVFSAFIASLTSALTLSKLVSTDIDIDSLKPLHLGVVKGGISEDLVKRMNIRCSTYSTSQEVFTAIINKDVDGYLYDEATLRYYVAMDYQDKIVLHQTRLPGLIYAFAFPMASQTRKPVNVTLLTLMQQPLWESLLRYYGLDERSDVEERPSRKKKHHQSQR